MNSCRDRAIILLTAKNIIKQVFQVFQVFIVATHMCINLSIMSNKKGIK